MQYIEFKNVVKEYKVKTKEETKNIRAINNLSFSIAKGEIIGYLGNNGSGKSTTVKMLSGILRPDEGSILVEGKKPYKTRRKYVKNIGVMFGQRSQLEWDLPAIDTFKLLKKIYKIDNAKYDSQYAYLEEKLDLFNIVKTPVRQLSLGQRMRCELAATFLHKPDLCFLDEPTIGMDIEMKQKVQEFIKEININFGTTIIITSHNIDDIESVATRLIIIDKGTLYFDGTKKELYEQENVYDKMIINLLENKQFKLNYDIKYIQNDKEVIIELVPNNISMHELLKDVVASNELKDFYIEKPKLDDVLIKLYQKIKYM